MYTLYDMGKNEIFTTASLEGGVLGGKESRRSAGSPPSPAGLSSAAVVNKKRNLKEEDTYPIRTHRAL